MAKKYYNRTNADYVTIKFRCSCGQEIDTGLIPVRNHYDNSKEVNSFYHDKPILCCHCRKEHSIQFYDNVDTGLCEIPTLENNDSIISLHEIPFEYAGDYDTSFVDYIEEIVNIKHLIKSIKGDGVYNKDILFKMALIYLISVMDAYLANTFKYNVSKYQLFKNEFISFINAHKKRTQCVLEELDRQSFQNLKDKAIPYYKHVFGIEIPENQIIQNAVHIRNSVIHNNGREKNGYKNSVTEQFIEELIPQIETLVRDVNQKIIDVVFDKIVTKNIVTN